MGQREVVVLGNAEVREGRSIKFFLEIGDGNSYLIFNVSFQLLRKKRVEGKHLRVIGYLLYLYLKLLSFICIRITRLSFVK